MQSNLSMKTFQCKLFRKRSLRNYLTAVTLAAPTISGAANAFAQGKGATWYSIEPAGKTLPAGVVQLRGVVAKREADASYDSEGTKATIPYDITINANAVAFELGLTNRLSLQILATQYAKQDVVLRSATALRETAEYTTAYDAAVSAAVAEQAAALQALGLCPDLATCSAAINSGTATDPDTGLPILTVIQSAVDSAIVAAAGTAYEEGETGIGDTQIGFLYALKPTGKLQSSIGLGLRLPTGSFKDTPSTQIPTGRGITEAGLQFNLDFAPFQGLMISLQDQAGLMLQKGKKTSGETTVDVERKGIRHQGFARVAWGLGMFGNFLVPFGITGTYNFDLDNEEQIDGTTTKEKSTRNSLATGLRLDLYSNWKIPLRFDFEQERTLSGKNSYALAGTTASMKLLLKF